MRTKIHSLDEKFLDKWSPKMAYILGFWFADGYMRHEKSYRIMFSSGEREPLLKIRECLNSNHPIYRRNDRDFQLIVFSKRLYYKLIELGGKRAKSKTIEFPFVPSKYTADFVRGYFDGDGSVFYTTYMHTKIKRLRTELRSNFTSGSPTFLDGLQDILANTLGFIKKKICSYNDGSSYKLGYGTYDTMKLLKFMYYPNFPIGLERKALFTKNI
ncbi:MAG: hypothetical protein HYT20_03585 [Candidatus Nealsonbacteria bacterium]|nr:hypothetical protein [Candidatus Nealsonbacteria bacterium]